jgi:hypothetical protein
MQWTNYDMHPAILGESFLFNPNNLKQHVGPEIDGSVRVQLIEAR